MNGKSGTWMSASKSHLFFFYCNILYFFFPIKIDLKAPTKFNPVANSHCLLLEFYIGKQSSAMILNHTEDLYSIHEHVDEPRLITFDSDV